MISIPPVAGLSSRYSETRCLASLRSLTSSILSRTRYRRSNREMSVGGRSMLRVMGQLRLYFDPTGFAAARIEVRALRVVMIPALAIETVCCSCWVSRKVSEKGKGEGRRGRTDHDFVENTPSRVGHLVKLVDAADSAVGENERSTGGDELEGGSNEGSANKDEPLEDELLRVGVARDVGGQSDGRRSLAGRVDTTRSDLVNVL